MGLHEAREKALQCRRLRLEDLDPDGASGNLYKRQRWFAAANLMTFDQCAAAYIAPNEMS